MSDQHENAAQGPEPERPEAAPPPEPPKDAPAAGAQAGSWERELLTRLAYASLLEQRRARRWGLVFKLGVLVYLVAILVLYTPGGIWPDTSEAQHSALVDVRGVISDGGDASADRIVTGLRAAFEDEDTKGVILRINSPGGTPVQSAYINEEIRRLRAEHPDTPLYAVISDMAASGGYYIAVAADEIYANESSIVGSIGVLMNGFGFVEAMDKLGVERRLLTAGKSKGLLDPFSPSDAGDVEHIQGMLESIHAQFIEAVRAGRGDRLSDDERLFTGLVWTGAEGLSLGLVDAFGSSAHVAREVIGAEDIKDFTPRRSFVDRLARRMGTELAEGVMETLGADRITLR